MSLVREFHSAFNLPAPQSPPLIPGPELVRLRARLIREEYEEVIAELATLANVRTVGEASDSMARLLKELADLRYVVEGTAVSLGLPIEPAFFEVHRSNMSKLGRDGKPVYREDGKVLKGPFYEEADMTQFLPSTTDIKE